MRLRIVLLALASLHLSQAHAFERDVHFGLTKWLAIQAGYTPGEAQSIATGDQRVDRGGMEFMELMSAYACFGHDAEGSANVEAYGFPSAGRPGSPPAQRIVVAGSAEARAEAQEVLKIDASKVGFTLYKFGAALHVLQDSWSHQGVPSVPILFGKTCDPGLAWGHPVERGGWNSHRADLTWPWPADTLAMAEASYRILLAYPPISGAKRTALDWERLKPLVASFAEAKTKAEKIKWFVDQQIADTSLMSGTSLPDGPMAMQGAWAGDKLPALASIRSNQHSIDATLTDFLSHFFSDWISSNDFAAMGSRYALPKASAQKAATPAMSPTELAARLQVWRMRDHGSVSDIAHSLLPLAPKQLAALKKFGQLADAYASYSSVADAFVPILPKTTEPAPLVPYLVSGSPTDDSAESIAYATFRFKHTPYDSLIVESGRIDGRWVILSIASIVEH